MLYNDNYIFLDLGGDDMARRQKTLEEQLANAQADLTKAKEAVTQCESRIKDIKQQIDDRDMKEAFAIMKANNISVGQLQALLSKQGQTKSERKTA